MKKEDETSGITPQIGKHMVNDFMELIVKNGILSIAEEVKQ